MGAVGDVARPTVWMLSDIPHAGSCVFDLCLACLIFWPLAMVDKSCCCGPLAAFVVLFSALDACPKSKTELLRRRRLLRSSVFSTVFRFAAPPSLSLSLSHAHTPIYTTLAQRYFQALVGCSPVACFILQPVKRCSLNARKYDSLICTGAQGTF